MRFNQPPEEGHIVFFNRLDVYHKTPSSSERQYKMKITEKGELIPGAGQKERKAGPE
jgi:hypothetical protein